MAKSSTSYQEGQSGNPNGRPPKGYSITELMRELMETSVKNKQGEMVNVRKAIALSILQKAADGDMVAGKMIWQYMDGMPKQLVEMDTSNDDAVKRVAELINVIRQQPRPTT